MNGDLLEIMRHIVSGLTALFGAAILLVNIGVLFCMHKHKRHASLVPFLGGGLLLLASSITPLDLPAWLAWCFLLIDPGCSFYMAHGLTLLFRSTQAR